MSFWCLQFSQTMNENNSTWGTIVVKLIFFVHFLGELKILRDLKFWLLAYFKFCWTHTSLFLQICLLGIFNSPKKRMKKSDFTTMVPQVKLFLFVCRASWKKVSLNFCQMVQLHQIKTFWIPPLICNQIF